jgi:hypothetical protein
VVPFLASTGVANNTHMSFAVLDLPQARRNSRRTRRYRAAHDTVGKSEEQLATSFALVEKFCKDHKAHRNVLDQDTKEIKAAPHCVAARAHCNAARQRTLGIWTSLVRNPLE